MPLIDRWQRLGKRQQMLGLTGAGICAWLISDAIALRPLRQHVRQLHREVTDAEQQLLQATTALQHVDEVNKAFGAYAPYVHPAGSAEAELAGFVSEVESAVHQSGMSVVNLKPVTTHEGDTAPRLRVALEGESSPAQLIQFLNAIQRSTRLLKVTEFSARSTEHKTLRSSLVISKLLLK